MARFVQSFAPLPDPYDDDHVLRATLDRLLGDSGARAAAGPLKALSADVAGPLRAAARNAEAHPPVLRQYDGWGRRVDEIDTSPGWETLRQASARHGLVALPYEEQARATWGAGARVVQLAALHLYGPESATYSCPVAMSDGAVAVLVADGVDPGLRDALVPRLLDRDPDRAWTSGQWMTETEGGSDVGRATTAAVPQGDGSWRLTGEKWFCSATTSELAVALARPEGGPPGTRGLGCFVIPRYAEPAADLSYTARPATTAPGLTVHRLKDKLGTRALPSAEIGLSEALAWPVGDPTDGGLLRMMTMVQVTRLHNAAAAAAGMRRGLMLVRNHAASREAFGQRLEQLPLHRETLAWLAVDAEGAFALTALCFDLLGRVEVHADAEAGRLLRVAASLAKALTAKLAVASASEYVECFGGNGFIEDTGIPRMLRDAQVLPIWEGTTNIQSLDLLRALGDPRYDGLSTVSGRIRSALDGAAASGQPTLAPLVAPLRQVLADVLAAAEAILAGGVDAQARARDLLVRLASLLAAAALLEQAGAEACAGNARTALVASLWVRRRVLGDPAAGAGHEGFAHIVDGRPC
ncbi:MAG: acyl-CoA dehydrogenase family protein [Actinomycetota bacterium]|nr:acyl-CoA dehydrogenase family protein [Actinomycetota bacterium]